MNVAIRTQPVETASTTTSILLALVPPLLLDEFLSFIFTHFASIDAMPKAVVATWKRQRNHLASPTALERLLQLPPGSVIDYGFNLQSYKP